MRRYAILDTPREAEFDDFTRIAAYICRAPVSVINLIDEGRQWFKSEIGLGVRETPLDVSICARVLLQPGVTVVPDLRQDPRFGCNPLVTGEPHLRFYGGALLETREGLPLGTLCVLDYRSRPEGLDPDQRLALQALARQIVAQLDLRRALQDRRRAEAALQQALGEKDLLMQEVHHRVKNSLQMVQNLLGFQARASGEPRMAALLAESSARIRTIASLHDRLYRDGSALEVEVGPYLRALTDDLDHAMTAGRRITLEADPAIWPASEVPTLGLVLTELITNALKYGAGQVSVAFRQAPGQPARLTVSDEGSGLPAGFDPTESRGLGMRLILGLLRGKGGEIMVEHRPHTCFQVILPAHGAGS